MSRSRRRILFVITGLQGGGAEMMLLHLLRGLDRERFEPVVVALLGEGRLQPQFEALGVPVHRLQLAQGRFSPAAAWRLASLARAAKPDLIQGWMYHGNLAAQMMTALTSAPAAWCIQNSFHSFAAERPLTRLIIRALALLSGRAARIVYVSHASKDQHEAIGFSALPGVVIPNGADGAVFKPSAKARSDVRAELGLGAETPLIGLMARYHPQKDHATFMRAAAILSETRPTVHFVLAGAGIDSSNRALAALALPVAGRVHLLGERTDAPRINAALDVGTSSSSYGEALSLAVAEAMACAVPCVVTNVGDSALLVGETGVIVPPGDARALADGWATALDERARLGPQARARALAEFSVASIVEKYEELFETLAKPQ